MGRLSYRLRNEGAAPGGLYQAEDTSMNLDRLAAPLAGLGFALTLPLAADTTPNWLAWTASRRPRPMSGTRRSSPAS
jgi:hypothetical protein